MFPERGSGDAKLLRDLPGDDAEKVLKAAAATASQKQVDVVVLDRTSRDPDMEAASVKQNHLADGFVGAALPKTDSAFFPVRMELQNDVKWLVRRQGPCSPACASSSKIPAMGKRIARSGEGMSWVTHTPGSEQQASRTRSRRGRSGRRCGDEARTGTVPTRPGPRPGPTSADAPSSRLRPRVSVTRDPRSWSPLDFGTGDRYPRYPPPVVRRGCF